MATHNKASTTASDLEASLTSIALIRVSLLSVMFSCSSAMSFAASDEDEGVNMELEEENNEDRYSHGEEVDMVF